VEGRFDGSSVLPVLLSSVIIDGDDDGDDSAYSRIAAFDAVGVVENAATWELPKSNNKSDKLSLIILLLMLSCDIFSFLF